MVEAVAERKPKKLFGKKKPQLTVVPVGRTESLTCYEPIDLFSQSLKQEILLQDNKIEAVIRSASDNVSQFQGPRVLDWNKSTGRVALAESVIQNSEGQFLAFRRQMEMMADRDGCGGRNEMGTGNKSLELAGNKTTNLNDFKAVKGLGDKSHSEGKHDHCNKCGEDLKDGQCSKCAA